jgi:hypothetical protein
MASLVNQRKNLSSLRNKSSVISCLLEQGTFKGRLLHAADLLDRSMVA